MRIHFLALAGFALLACLGAPPRAGAQTTFSWNNAGGGSYHTVGNWTPGGGPPIFDDFAVFNLAATYGVTFSNSGTQTIDFQVRNGTVTMSYLNATANHTWTAGGTNRVGPQAGDAHSSATLNLINMSSNPMSGGNLIVGHAVGKTGTLNINTSGRWQGLPGANATVGSAGTGNLNVTTTGILQTSSLSANNIAVGTSGGTGNVLISGFNASVTATNVMAIGEVSSLGTVTVQNQGQLIVQDTLYVGVFSNANNVLTVTGAGSQVQVGPDSLFVGYAGTGTLNVQSGGAVSSTASTQIVGYSSEGHGTVNVTGANSLFGAAVGNTNRLIIGDDAIGQVNVTLGGKLSFARYTLGNAADSNGSLTVSGSGSLAEATTTNNQITVGNNGTGTLTLQSGGQFTAANVGMNLMAGANVSGTGTITITGGNSRLTLSGQLVVGGAGTGSLDVASTGEVESRSGVLGAGAGGMGTATLSTGSTWVLTGPNTVGTLTVGGFGTGTLTVNANSEVTARGYIFGQQTGSIGTGLATGSGALLTANGSDGVTVGQSSNGSLTIQSTAQLIASGQVVWVGRGTGGTGALTLQGSSMTSLNLIVGDHGTGTATFKTGSTILTTNHVDVGNAATGVGTISVANPGTNWTVNGGLRVGQAGQGTLIVQNGAVVNSSSASIASQFGATGTVTVGGLSAALNTTGAMQVGGAAADGGVGTLNITNGGAVSVGTAITLWSQGTINLAGGSLQLQQLVDQQGTFNWTAGTLRFTTNTVLNDGLLNRLVGTGHVLTTNQTLATTPTGGIVVGLTHFTVDGGQVLAIGMSNVGITTVNRGSVQVTNQLLNDVQGTFIVQNTGQASFSGGVQNNGTFQLGGLAAKSSGGAFVNNGTLLGTGTLAHAFTNSATGTVQIGATDRLVVANTASMNTNLGVIQMAGGRLDLTGEFTNDNGGFISGRGTLATATATPGAFGLSNRGIIAFSGGASDVFGDVIVGGDGQFITSGGGVTTFHDDVTHNGREIRTAAGSHTVFLGSVEGAGPYNGNGTVHFEGDLRPGNSPANVLFEGDVEFSPTARLHIELDGILAGAEYDRLSVAGSVSLGGTLSVSTLGGFVPTTNLQFIIIDNAGTDLVVGTFAGLGEGASFVSGEGHLFTITYQGGTGNDVVLTAVPEPLTLGLIGLASAMMSSGWYWRRQRNRLHAAELVQE